MKKLFVVGALLCSVLGSNNALALDCFDGSFVQSWSYDADTEVLLVNSFQDTYEVKTFMPCYELSWATGVAFRSFLGSQVCHGDDVLAVDAFNRVTQVCMIDTVVKR